MLKKKKENKKEYQRSIFPKIENNIVKQQLIIHAITPHMLSLEHLVFRTSSRASTVIKKMKNWRQISELAFPKEEGEKEEERSRDKVTPIIIREIN